MLDEIEADLQRCQAILADSLRSCDGLPVKASINSLGAGAAAPARPPRQHPTPPSPLPVPPGEVGPSPRPLQQGSSKPAARPKPKSMADLLAMLEDAPAGPVEIDTALLYSPAQSSADLHSSPSSSTLGGYSVGGRDRGSRNGESPAAQARAGRASAAAARPPSQLRQEFSLKAYRPSAGGELLADAFGSSLQLASDIFDDTPPSSQHSLDWGLAAGLPHSGIKKPAGVRRQQQQQQRLASPGLLSPADSEVLRRLSQPRPRSAPQHQHGGAVASPAPTSPCASSISGRSPAGCGGGAALRQLCLDDVIAAGVAGTTAGLLAAGRGARLQRLAQPRNDLWERCARRKMEEEQETLKECTFVPQVGRPPEGGRRVRPGGPVDERLYRLHEGKWEALERAKAEHDSAQLAECTFAPQLNQPEKHLRGEYRPIHKRVGEEQKKRSVKLAQLRVLEDLTNPHTTFTPRLNPRSLQLAAEKEERELYSPSPSSSGLRRSKSFAELGEDSGCTFSPSLNPASQRLLEDSATVPTDFQERLRFYSQRRDAKQKQMQAEQDAQSCTFRPDTGNAVEVLAFSAGRAGQLLETEAERVERMAREEAERLEARRAAKEREVYGGLDFKPALNPRSLRMAKGSTVEELASAEKATAKLARLRAEEEERLRAECTFRPNTAKPRVVGYGEEYEQPRPRAKLSIAGQDPESILERIQDYQAEKEAKAAKAKEEEERRQLQECSFAPQINRQLVKAKGPVVVRGLDRYLELKQMAERQKKEAEERAAQVFKLNPQGPPAARTVPQPFKLSGLARLEQRAQAKQSELLQTTLQERLQECTFRPQTNHAKRQQALSEMLKQQDLASV